MESQNGTSKTNRWHKPLLIGLTTIALWGLAYSVWYYCYWFITLPGTEPSFFLTFLVIPLPFIIYCLFIKLRPTSLFSRLSRFLRASKWFILISFIVCLAALFLPRCFILVKTQSRIFSVNDVIPKKVAIVFGGGINSDGTLTPEVAERIETAADLYFAGKANKLLMSGDNRFVDYNEPGAMQKYAIQMGVPVDSIVLDYAGRSTYDTCYRAGYIFKVKEAILITQQYHLSRAIFTCNELGLNAVGVPAHGDFPYIYGNLREFPAAIAMLWEIYISHPLPVLGNSEPID